MDHSQNWMISSNLFSARAEKDALLFKKLTMELLGSERILPLFEVYFLEENSFGDYWYILINSWVNGKVLDVGCGLGLYLESRKDAIGVDINKYCVSHCRFIFKLGSWKNKLPFPNNSRMARLCSITYLNIWKNQSYYLNVHAYADDGRLIILVPGRKGYSRDTDHKVFISFSSIRKLAVEFGFSVIKERSIPLAWWQPFSSFCYFCVLEKSAHLHQN